MKMAIEQGVGIVWMREFVVLLRHAVFRIMPLVSGN